MTTVPFATGPSDLDSQFLPMKSFTGVLNQVVPHLGEEQKYVDVHFVEITILEMEDGQVMWPHPTRDRQLPVLPRSEPEAVGYLLLGQVHIQCR